MVTGALSFQLLPLQFSKKIVVQDPESCSLEAVGHFTWPYSDFSWSLSPFLKPGQASKSYGQLHWQTLEEMLS